MADRNILSLQLALALTGNEYIQVLQPTGLAPPLDYLDKKLLTSNFLSFSAGAAVQNANTFYSGPASAGPSIPTFRALVNADIPTLATLNFSSGGVINFNAGDVTVTHSANALSFAGATSNYTFNDGRLDVIQAAAASNPSVIARNTTDNATVAGLRIEGDRATPANFDQVYGSWYLSNSGGTQLEAGRVSTQWNSFGLGTEQGRMIFSVMDAGAIGSRMFMFPAALTPVTTDTMSLGTTGLNWSDLFLDLGGVINFDSGDVTITHSANSLAFVGASTSYSFDNIILCTQSVGATTAAVRATNSVDNASVRPLQLIGARATPAANDVLFMSWQMNDSALVSTEFGRMDVRATTVTDAAEVGEFRFWLMSAGTLTTRYTMTNSAFQPISNNVVSLGISGLSFADLFLGSGAVIDFNAGDVTITHATNNLLFAGATSGYVFDALVAITRSGAPLQVTNIADSSAVQCGRFDGDRATPTNNDNLFHSWNLSDSAGNQTEFARSGVQATSVTDGAETGQFFWQGITSGGAITTWARITGTEIRGGANDLLALGTGTVAFSDLFLASGGVINFNNGNVTLTHAAATLTIAGATSFVDAASHTILNGTAVPAGGTTGAGYKLSSTSNLGVFFGSGAPTLSAAQGSLYIRTDGSSTSTRLYVNTNGTTGWTNFTSAT